MTIETHELKACPGCGATGSVTLSLGERQLLRCTNCSLVYALEYAAPEAVYVEGYLKGETEFGLDIMHPIFQDFLDYVADRRLQMLERVTGKPGRLLDVGCGSGEVLRAAAARGWTAAGVEPVEESVAIAKERGLDVTCAFLEESGLPERSYDVVSAFHVLEHMSDGLGLLQTMARWAKPGGYVFIEVPNWRSFHRRNNGQNWPGLRPLEHLAHYEPATLEATIERAGLRPVSVRTATYLWSGQTLGHALADLARPRWYRWLAPISSMGELHGEAVKRPSPPVKAILDITRRAYDRAKVGSVVLGIGQVPAA